MGVLRNGRWSPGSRTASRGETTDGPDAPGIPGITCVFKESVCFSDSLFLSGKENIGFTHMWAAKRLPEKPRRKEGRERRPWVVLQDVPKCSFCWLSSECSTWMKYFAIADVTSQRYHFFYRVAKKSFLHEALVARLDSIQVIRTLKKTVVHLGPHVASFPVIPATRPCPNL